MQHPSFLYELPRRSPLQDQREFVKIDIVVASVVGYAAVRAAATPGCTSVVPIGLYVDPGPVTGFDEGWNAVGRVRRVVGHGGMEVISSLCLLYSTCDPTGTDRKPEHDMFGGSNYCFTFRVALCLAANRPVRCIHFIFCAMPYTKTHHQLSPLPKFRYPSTIITYIWEFAIWYIHQMAEGYMT